MKFRRKPVVIEAIQWTGAKESLAEILNFCPTCIISTSHTHALYIDTLEGRHRADVGDWIIKGVKGEFYPCKPDIFEATYERVE